MRKCLFIITIFFNVFFVKAQEPILVLPIGHTSFVNIIQFSPNEDFVVTASSDATIKLWDKITGKLLHTYEGHTQSINAIAFNKEGNLLASASNDSTIIIWEIITGKILHQLKGHTAGVAHIEFKNNAAEILSSSFRDGTVKIWNIQNGNLIEDINAVSIDKGTYSYDDKYLMLTLHNNTVAVCYNENNSTVCNSFIRHRNTITNAIFLPDTSGIITTSLDSSLIFWTINGKVIKEIKLDFPVDDLVLSADKKTMTLTSYYSPYAEVRKIYDTTLLGRFGVNDSKYSNRIKAKYSPQNNFLFLALNDTDSAFVFSVDDKIKKVASFYTQHQVVNDINFNNSGNQFLLSTTQSNNPSLWKIGNNEAIINYRGFTNNMTKAVSVLNDSLTVVQSPYGRVEVWNNQQNIIAYIIPKKIVHSKISQSENKMITIDNENTIELWDIKTGKLLQQMYAGIIKSDYIHEVPLWAEDANYKKQKPSISNKHLKTNFPFEVSCFNNKETLVATASYQTDGVAIWNLKSGEIEFTLNIGVDGVFDIAFSPNNNQLIAVGRNGVAVIVDILTKEIFELKGHTSGIKNVHFNEQGNIIYTSSYDSTIKIWNTHNQQLVYTIPVGESILNTVVSTQKNLLIATTSKSIKAWLLSNYTSLFSVTPNNNFIQQIQLFKNSPEILVSFSANEAPILINELTGKKLYTFPLAMMGNISIANNDSMITTIYANKISRWNKNTSNLISSFFSINTSDYLSLTNDKYYKCTPNATKMLHYVTKDLKIISFEQLDVKYNRPDKVLEAIGSTDTALINSYQKAYQKRIKKLGIDTTQFKEGYSIPEADFINSNNIEYEQNKDKLVLKIHGTDSTYKLDRFNVWVNEVPVFGLRGLHTKRKNSFDTTIIITLSKGENRIETSITNVNGTESYKMPLFIKYTPTNLKKEKAHFIGIGIDEFSNADYNLRWSVKDIQDLAVKLQSKYPNIIIDTLFNKNVTKENILSLKKKLLQLNEDDKVIVSYSGHGVLSKGFDYFLSTYNITFDNPEQNGLAYDDLENLLDSIKPRKKLMFIDACHSGEVDKEELSKIENSKSHLDSNGIVANKSTIKVTEKKKTLGMKNSFELMQSLFVNVGKGTGATIISAAGGTQYAQERGDLKNGVFTYSVIEAFNNHKTLTVSELKKIVGERVIQLTNGLQKPTSRNETNNYDWIVW